MYFYNVCKGNKEFQLVEVENAKALETVILDLKKMGHFSYIRGPFSTAEKAKEALKNLIVYCEGVSYV